MLTAGSLIPFSVFKAYVTKFWTELETPKERMEVAEEMYDGVVDNLAANVAHINTNLELVKSGQCWVTAGGDYTLHYSVLEGYYTVNEYNGERPNLTAQDALIFAAIVYGDEDGGDCGVQAC